MAAAPVYSEWVNSGALAGCSNWTPDPSTMTAGAVFTQNATNCTQEQTRTRQDRKQETTLLMYRNVGMAVNEGQTLSGLSSSRGAVGTKENKVCMYSRNYPGSSAFYSSSKGAWLWTSGYSGAPSLIINTSTGTGIMGDVVPGLLRVSSTEFRYTTGSNTLKITRGNYAENYNGTNFYQVCYE